MKAYLRINKGLLTKIVNIPDHCVRTDFRVPWDRKISANSIGEIAAAGAFLPPSVRCLVFQWDRVSKDAADIPILDLIEVT